MFVTMLMFMFMNMCCMIMKMDLDMDTDTDTVKDSDYIQIAYNGETLIRNLTYRRFSIKILFRPSRM